MKKRWMDDRCAAGAAKGVLALAVALAASGAMAAMDTGTIDGNTTQLYGGTVYTVSGNVTNRAAATHDALTVIRRDGTAGNLVVINIPEGASLTVQGGAASGRSSAGAGIRLPSDVTLYVTGAGTLTATGGNAASGGNGAGGGNAEISGWNFKNGCGGAGGGGGGGAGAGIGGAGGAGGAGGTGASQGSSRYASHGNDFPHNGDNGSGGSGGAAGAAGGSVYVLGDVAVTVRGGAAGAAGGAGGYGTYKQGTGADDWFSGGGGPGGGGGGGGASMSIGGGGGGGAGGGGGGSGSYLVVDDWDDPDNEHLFIYDGQGVRIVDEWTIRGECGGAGGGGKVGGRGGDGKEGSLDKGTKGGTGKSHKNYSESTSSSKAGDGAAGGNGGEQGAGGKVVVLPTAALSCSPACTVDNGSGLPQEQFLKVTVTLDFGLKENGSAKTMTFEQPFACKMVPLSDAARVTHAGYRFAGYWLDDGTCVYGPDYKATMVMSPYVQDITLHARWEVDGSILAVTSSGDGASTLDVYGNTAVTLRDAVAALAADPLLVGADGRRRVVFALPETNTVVRLEREISVPAGTRAFEINGLYGLTNGVRLVAGTGARHLRFEGPAEKDAAFELSSLTFEGGNPGQGAGGAILAEGGASVSVAACSFLGNRAGRMKNGGAISAVAAASELLVWSTTFAGNSAYNGGAVHVDGARSTFVNTTFSGNSATASGGGISTGNKAPVELLACTFARNSAGQRGASLSSTCTLSNAVRAVNCIFADTDGGREPVATEYAGALAADWCSLDVPPETAFASFGAPVTQMVDGVTHVVHPPLAGERSHNEDAAEIYRDADYEHLLAVGRDGRRVTLSGDPELADIPFVTDQLLQLRTSPTRGAVRLAVGTEPVTVELDGVLCDEEGRPRPNAVVDSPVEVFYDGGESTVTAMTIRTAAGGVFGLSVPVDGSDGLAHNVTGIQVDALGPDPITVATAPYALKAASVDLIASPDYVTLEGDGVAIGNVVAASISAQKSFDARSADSFTAGSLKGFGNIDLEHVSVSGGSLKWLGGSGPAQGVAFANLESMSVGGGVEAFTGKINVPYKTQTTNWQAAVDGFMQLEVRAPSKPAHEYLMVAVNVLDAQGKFAFTVTPRGLFGAADQRALWTIPVCKGQYVELKLDEDVSGKPTVGIPVHAQFIYFGVPE